MSNLTAAEQLILELVNRARLNPAGEAARLHIALNEGLPSGTISTASKEPLASNSALHTAARNHSQHMLGVDQFAHSGIGDGDPASRAQGAGYPSSFVGENIAVQGVSGTPNEAALAVQNYENLFIDSGIAGRGHRTNILSTSYREIGVGEIVGQFTFSGGQTFNSAMLTQDFGNRLDNKVFITGVAIKDADKDNFYDIGEGHGGVKVTVKSGSTIKGTDTTEPAGGYAVAVSSASSYSVTFSGGGLASSVKATISGVTKNIKLDLLDKSELLSSASTTLGSGAKDLGLLGTLGISGTGNSLSNHITGNKGANTLKGEGGNDTLSGASGNDKIDGGSGNDKITGGSGRDTLTGGTGDDDFIYRSTSETGKTSTTRDLIKGFSHGHDDIDLSAIDANGSASGSPKFNFRATEGASFTGVKGQVIWKHLAANTLIQGDINGDKHADFQIELSGHKTLTASDFIL